MDEGIEKKAHLPTKALVSRINRITGHLESVKRMIEENRSCSEILIQIAAIRSSINGLGQTILQGHLEHCIVDAAKKGDQKVIDDLNDAIEKFLKF